MSRAHRQILIVDDNQNLTIALTIGLRRAGFQVEVASHGHEALAHLTERRFDAILTDVQMPFLSGVEFVREVEARFPRTRLIVMSAFEKPVDLGSFPFLSKPFHLDSLIDLLSGKPGEQSASRVL